MSRPQIEVEKEVIKGFDPENTDITIKSICIDRDDDTVTVFTSHGKLVIQHYSECCESVVLAQVPEETELKGIEGNRIGPVYTALVERRCLWGEMTDTIVDITYDYSQVLRFTWRGESNGYYGTTVDFNWEPTV